MLQSDYEVRAVYQVIFKNKIEIIYSLAIGQKNFKIIVIIPLPSQG
jgi:hypothetical protein